MKQLSVFLASYFALNRIWHSLCRLLSLQGKGFFMHFSTAAAESRDQAFLESRWLYPKSGAQCLQFFLHNSGATDDVLNIWVREYDKANPSSSKLKLFKSISGRKRRRKKNVFSSVHQWFNWGDWCLFRHFFLSLFMQGTGKGREMCPPYFQSFHVVTWK